MLYPPTLAERQLFSSPNRYASSSRFKLLKCSSFCLRMYPAINGSSNLKKPRNSGLGSSVSFVPSATGSKRKLPWGVAGPAASPSKAIFLLTSYSVISNFDVADYPGNLSSHR
jgi:hypothetical protein